MSNSISNTFNNNLKALHAAHALSSIQRQELAFKAIKGDTPVSHIAAQHDVSRKFVYQQKTIALEALSEAFDSEKVDESEVLFFLPITKKWIHSLVLALILICHSSFRGVCEILKDLFGVSLSIGSIHNISWKAMQMAKHRNSMEDLSQIRVGAHDEIFQGSDPVLVGCDTYSTYCYLLEAAESRDAETWGVALLEAGERGLKPDYTIGDGGKGLRAGQELAWPEIPCHGDVFHALHDFGKACLYLDNRAYSALAAREKAEQKMAKVKRSGKGNTLSRKLGSLRAGCERAIALADDVKILLEWMRCDILSVVGPDLKTREELFDFVVAELKARENPAPHRIGPIRRTLENQRDNLLRFAGLIDKALKGIADEHDLSEYRVRSVYLLENPGLTPDQRSTLEKKVRRYLNHRFCGIGEAVREIIGEVVRASSVVENLNSRLRNYFFLRKQIGPSYLELLRFFLNHRRFVRSEHPDRVGKSPREIMTGQPHAHWLDLLNLTSCQIAA
jgi:hypothetical protein